jgi:hypothetical protein
MLATKILTDYDMKQREGQFFDRSHYHTVIDSHADFLVQPGVLLFSLRKNAIPIEISNIARNYLLPKAIKTKSDNRYIAAGKTADPVKSMIAGYYDKAKRCNGSGNQIRLTAFSEKFPIEWNNSIWYVKYLNDLYSELFPENYIIRKNIANKINYGMIPQTIFSTLTLNYNFRTACHVDNGDTSYSILTTIGEFTGCLVGFPQYGVCINLKENDFLIMNPHEYHCNTEFIGNNNNRMSIVTYTRDKIVNQYDDWLDL